MLTPMALEWEQITVDSFDPISLGQWWAAALGWVVVDETEEIIEIRPEPDRMPGLLFVPVPEGKVAKNRLHPDFRPDDHEAEVDRLVSLGARRAGPVQEGQHWVTLFDPEGNEFCVLSEPRS
ncbi:VOC family protein [Streptomyces alkaliphilus]|uniref:VOC family protein n=2 Tax=Streptomyces alkaliphilus TaxID=1472722 RepID=A0A7W3T9Q4_9ACTN|nr:VOC family protein [Streptomyces alkaliphilus]